MTNIFKVLSSLFLGVMLFFMACTTNPILVEILSGPIEEGPIDSLILVTEENVCESNTISFERQIFPLLVSGCGYSGCHDNTTHKEGVRMTSYSNIIEEVRPNNASSSSLYKAITDNPSSEKFMPPRPAISFNSEQIQLIKDWIDRGALNSDCNIPCNSVDASFSQDVFPIIQNTCLGCHQPTNSLGSINLIDFEHIRSIAINGQLMGSIKHIAGYKPMPETSNKLTNCQIATIHNWIVDGMPNN